MALSTLRNPLRHAPSAVLSGWLPRGFISTRPVSDLVERFVDGPWPDHPACWAVACDYGSGRRVAFGRADAPPASAGDAVAASCAIPGFYHPVRIAGRRYVDGGVCSASNLDLVRDQDLGLVVCLNPMTSLAQVTPRSAADRMMASMRAAMGRRLGHEARKLRERGVEVLILQPTAEDLAIMGANFMARHNRTEVAERAVRTTARQLRRLRARDGAPLPGRRRAGRAGRARRAGETQRAA